MPERPARDQLAEHRATRRVSMEPCRTKGCPFPGWYQFPGDVARCSGCGTVLTVTFAIAAEPATTQDGAR